MSIPTIEESHLPTCKIGQGAECCRYLVFGAAFSCAKHSELKATIDARASEGKMNAMGDNCPGIFPPSSPPEVAATSLGNAGRGTLGETTSYASGGDSVTLIEELRKDLSLLCDKASAHAIATDIHLMAGINGAYSHALGVCDSLAAVLELREGEQGDSLRMLRDAWNAHMETCPVPQPVLPMPTREDIERWMNAPSDTASAEIKPQRESDRQSSESRGLETVSTVREEGEQGVLGSDQRSLTVQELLTCPESQRSDGDHSWRFDGDDPCDICVYCNERRGAISGKPVASTTSADALPETHPSCSSCTEAERERDEWRARWNDLGQYAQEVFQDLRAAERRAVAAEKRAALLDDDAAIMRGVAAARRLGQLRVGNQHDHAEAFRDALVGAEEQKKTDD